MYIFSHNWIKKLFSWQNKVPITLFKARNVKTVLKSVVLSGHFVYSVVFSHENEEKGTGLFSLFRHKTTKKSANEGIGSIEIKKSSPELQRVVALLM